MQQPDSHTIDIVVAIITFGALAIGLLSMLVGKVVDTWDRLRGVNTYEEGGAEVMSYDSEAAPPIVLSSLQTDSRQTADRQPRGPYPRDIMLNIYRVLRAHGVPREEARAMLKSVDLPLDNNLWSQAAPPPPPAVTPIAQRPTSATFHDDPDLEYKPL